MDTQKTENHALNQSDITNINVQLLQFAREIARNSKAQACIQFGISETFADQLVTMDLEAINRLARMPALIFAPRLPDDLLKVAAIAAVNTNQGALNAVASSISLR